MQLSIKTKSFISTRKTNNDIKYPQLLCKFTLTNLPLVNNLNGNIAGGKRFINNLNGDVVGGKRFYEELEF